MTRSSELPSRSVFAAILGSALIAVLLPCWAGAQSLEAYTADQEKIEAGMVGCSLRTMVRSSPVRTPPAPPDLKVQELTDHLTSGTPRKAAPAEAPGEADEVAAGSDLTSLTEPETGRFFNTPETPLPEFERLPRASRFLKDEITDDAPGTSGDSQNGVSEKFHWKPAVLQSIMIQGFQHGYALIVQERMRRELKGPFFKDYIKSVRGLHGWADGNRFFTNYIAHPMQGGMTGFIFLQNHDRLKKQKFSESKTYWVDRLKAMLWSAAWSTQWELGPFGQAAIGNVGLYKGMGYVDLVITPTAGTGWMVFEEAVDRYIVRHVEERTSFIMKVFLRTLLNPMRAVANVLRIKPPWHRDRPFGH